MAYHPCYEETGDVEYLSNTRCLPYSHHDYLDDPDFVNRIDPSLQYNTSCSIQHGDHLSASGMQRYLQEPQTNYFTAPRPFSTSNTYCTGIYPGLSPSIHQKSQPRHNSPTIYQQMSAASGSQSPFLTDNGTYVESIQGPSTPSDIVVLSPQSGSMGSPSPSVCLYGISNAPQGCVNPAIIQPNQTIHDINSEELGFSLEASADPRILPNYSCPESSLDSVSSADTPSSRAEARGHVASPYPELDEMDVDIDLENEHEIKSCISVAEDNDEEYKPSRKGKSVRTTKDNSRRGRTRRSSRANDAKPKANSRITTAPRLISSSPGGKTICLHCNMSFSDKASLHKHTNTVHTRPFTCVFHFAGCNKTFAKKNEWKRHVLAQHLNLDYWLCTAGACGYSPNSSLKGIIRVPTHCRVFRRKDLYTQHIRRMHAPPEVVSADKKDKNFPATWLVQEKKLQEGARRQRCKLPNFMCCPAKGCTTVFDNGLKTWDNRMEHVAVHLERAANNEEPPVVFGGVNDAALTEWASQPDVRVIEPTSKGWEMCQPLKAARTEISRLSSVGEGLDEDAEGEDAEGEEC
ncbi:hypothetical protein FGRMN_7969 [Fusarium graminum]|nr:hypothetical protein FGRMN_7969 [Fusarium graminum]